VPYAPAAADGAALPPVLRIALIVIAGDADLYVSTTVVYPGTRYLHTALPPCFSFFVASAWAYVCGLSTPYQPPLLHPSTSSPYSGVRNCTWASNSYGSDTLLIDPTAPPPRPGAPGACPAATTTAAAAATAVGSGRVSEVAMAGRGMGKAAGKAVEAVGAAAAGCVRCTYYIAVNGFKDCTYSLVATLGDGLLPLRSASSPS